MAKKDLKIISEKNISNSSKEEHEQIINNTKRQTSYFEKRIKKTPVTTSVKIYQEDWDFLKALAMYRSGLAKMNGNNHKIFPMDILSEIVDKLREKNNIL